MKTILSELQTYWFTPIELHGVPFGIGVTAFDLRDAHQLIQEQGWGIDIERALVKEGVTFGDLDQNHVVPKWTAPQNLAWKD